MLKTLFGVGFNPTIYLKSFIGKNYFDLPFNKNNKVDIDCANLDYSYDICITDNINNVCWSKEHSAIRILVDSTSWKITEMHYYDCVFDTILYTILSPENGYYNIQFL